MVSTRMKIAVNVRLLIENRLDGMGRFAFETLKRITRWHPETEFLFLFDRPYSNHFIFSPNITPLILPPPARHPFLWFAWLEGPVASTLRKHRPALFFSPDGFIPLNSRIPAMAVIHDLNFHHRPADLPLLTGSYYRYFFPRFARRASRLATVSEYSRNDLVNTYGVNPEKIDVVYNGASEVFKPLPGPEKEKTRKQLTGGSPYFIFVGNRHPRKNIPGLLRAYEAFSEKHSGDTRLVLVGEDFFKTGEAARVLKEMKHRQRVHFHPRMEQEELSRAMASSIGMVFIPWFEGFGIPLLEAMHCEVPVIASPVTSIPEVTGDAALFADPSHPAEVAHAMYRLVTEPQLAGSLVEKGRTQRARFSWDQTAEKIWKGIEKVLD